MRFKPMRWLLLGLLFASGAFAQTNNFNTLDKGGIQVLCKSAVAVSAPVDTTEDTLATCTVPANAMGANGIVRVSTAWTMTNSANSKTFRTRFSGGAGTVVATDIVTTQNIMRKLLWGANRGATNSQIFSSSASDEAGTGSFGVKGGGFAMVATAVDTTAATSIVLTCQKATAGETCTLESFLVELMPSN